MSVCCFLPTAFLVLHVSLSDSTAVSMSVCCFLPATCLALPVFLSDSSPAVSMSVCYFLPAACLPAFPLGTALSQKNSRAPGIAVSYCTRTAVQLSPL
jgi:hypothetical protein